MGFEANAGNSGQVFLRARAQGRAALVGYLPVGYPDVATSLAAFRALCGDGERPGVDLVEIGLPYTDPILDGPVIQRAGTAALDRGVRTRDVFAAVEAVASVGGTAVAMTYWNLVDRYGVDAFARDFANAGGAGLITPDLTPDEAEDWMVASEEHGLDRIFLVAPSSTDERIIATTVACRGWVYATAVMGVTGARQQTSSAAPELVARLRR
ncbi:MAG: tryptophan synthase subunit alpha, partial [Propionibacteriaceae bacterium]|nr:tryptophan synthase subunit alpha [Propionibacteriaceae bacterium]